MANEKEQKEVTEEKEQKQPEMRPIDHIKQQAMINAKIADDQENAYHDYMLKKIKAKKEKSKDKPKSKVKDVS